MTPGTLVKTFTLFFNFLIFSSSSLFAMNQMPADHSLSISLSTHEGSRSAIVAGCVNAVTGEFFQTTTDLIVPGVDAIKIQRTYASFSPEEYIDTPTDKRLPFGWCLNHRGIIKFFTRQTAPQTCCLVKTDNGYAFGCDAEVAGKTCTLKIANRMVKGGYTNASSEYIGGSTNTKNGRVYFDADGYKCTYVAPSGAVRKYSAHYMRIPCVPPSHRGPLPHPLSRVSARHKYDDYPRFILEEERLPSGNILKYSYDNFRISAIELLNAARAPVSKVICKCEGDNYSFCAPDGRKATVKSSKYIMTSISPEHYPITYECKKESRGIPSNYIHNIVERGGLFTRIEYYGEGSHTTAQGEKIRINSQDLFLGCVKQISQPSGIANKEVATYRFAYKVIKPGIVVTQVTDAKGNITEYEHGTTWRLLATRGSLNGKAKEEKFTWGESTYNDYGNLQSTKLYYEGKCVRKKELSYDSKGNIIEETIYGNLRGNPENGQDTDMYRKFFSFHDTRYHTVAAVKDGRKMTSYKYKEDTNLKTAEFVHDHEGIRLRKFFDYDCNAALISETVDDGCSENPADLAGVTHRRYKKIVPSQTFPVGYPLSIENGYLDLQTGQKYQLERIENEYTSTGLLEKQTFYDANDRFVYSISSEYDQYGNLLRRNDPLGRVTINRYDELGNLTQQEGPLPGHVTYKSYDSMRRPISEKFVGADGITVISTSKYNEMSRKIESTNSFGHSTYYMYDEDGNCTSTQLPAFYTADGQKQVPLTTVKYDALGHPCSIRDPLGQEIKIAYTVRGQPYHSIYPDKTYESKRYTIDGELEYEIAKNGLKTCYKKDFLGRDLVKELYSPSGKLLATTTYRYSSFFLLEEIDEKGISTAYSYDGAGRISSIRKGDDVIERLYDARGNISEERVCGNSQKYITTRKEYDLLGRLVKEESLNEEGFLQSTISYVYDAYDNLSKVIKQTPSGVSTTETHYNSLKQPILMVDSEGNQMQIDYDYHFVNEHGQRVLKVNKIDSLGNQQIEVQDTHGRPSVLIRKDISGNDVENIRVSYDILGHVVNSSVYHSEDR